MRHPPKSSSVVPITLPAQAKENDNNLEEEVNEKNAEEGVVQLLVKGVWVLRRLAANVCEVTFANRMEDTGDIPKKIFNMKVAR